MNKKIITITAVASLMAAASVYAGTEDSTATFLKIGVGARPAAMGEAYAGVKGDMLSAYFNPAGLSTIEGPELSFTHAFWFAGIDYSNFAAGFPILNGYMSIGANRLFYGTIDKYDSYGENIYGTYSPSDIAFSVSYARDVHDILTGMSLKYIASEIDGARANAYALDAGLMKELGDANVGFSVQNIGTRMKFRKEEESLPLIFRFGTSYPFSLGKLNMLAATEVNLSDNDSVKFNTGINADYPFENILFSLRLGAKSHAEGLDTLSHFTAGFGIGLSNIEFDYAYASFEDLGMIHRISLGYKL